MNDYYSGQVHGQDTEAINDFFDNDQDLPGYHDTPAIKMRQINPMVDQ